MTANMDYLQFSKALYNAQIVFENSGESSFSQLKLREKQEVFDIIVQSFPSELWEFKFYEFGSSFQVEFDYFKIDFYGRGGYLPSINNARLHLTDMYIDIANLDDKFSYENDTILTGMKQLMKYYGTEMRFVNLTNTPIIVINEHGTTIQDIPVAMLVEHYELNITETTLNNISHIPFIQFHFETNNLPKPEYNTYYILPMELASLLNEKRNDVIVPDLSTGYFSTKNNEKTLTIKRFISI